MSIPIPCLQVLSLFLLWQTASCNAQETPKPGTNTPPLIQQEPAPRISEYVVGVFEDSRGNKWFATMSDGVARYDGKTLTYFSAKDGLCENTVAGIAEDKEGNMWFGSHGGVTRYDGKTFKQYKEAEGMHGAGSYVVVDRDGNIWGASNHGAFRFDGEKFSEFKLPYPGMKDIDYKWEPNKIWGIMHDSQGNLWFARDGFGACKYDGTTFTHFTREDGLLSNNISTIVEDNDGNIWFGCLTSDWPKSILEGGVCRYDGKTFTQFPELKGLTKNDVYTIYKERSGNVWVCAVGVGAYRYDGKNFILFSETDRPDLIYNFGVQDILEDKNGILWFGFSGGLFRFNGASFTNVTREGPWN